MDDQPAEEAAADTAADTAAETKRRFREALERKKDAAHGRPVQVDRGSAIHGVQGRATGKREFRRKSG